MSEFQPGDKVIKRNEKDRSNWGEVMNLKPTQRKPGHIAVYFNRQVWIKPENLMYYADWKEKRMPHSNVAPESLKDYWMRG